MDLSMLYNIIVISNKLILANCNLVQTNSDTPEEKATFCEDEFTCASESIQKLSSFCWIVLISIKDKNYWIYSVTVAILYLNVICNNNSNENVILLWVIVLWSNCFKIEFSSKDPSAIISL